MMGAEAIPEKLFHLLISACVDMFLYLLLALTVKQIQKLWSRFKDLDKLNCRCVSLSSFMGKNDNLLSHLHYPHHVVKDDIIHYVIASLSISHFLDAVEGTLQRGRPETAVK